MDLMEECGLAILNGNKDGDWNGEIRHVGYRPKSVIDYGAANKLAWDDIVEFKVIQRWSNVWEDSLYPENGDRSSIQKKGF